MSHVLAWAEMQFRDKASVKSQITVGKCTQERVPVAKLKVFDHKYHRHIRIEKCGRKKWMKNVSSWDWSTSQKVSQG